jgi:hypothetical protein
MTQRARVILEGVVPFVAAGLLFGLLYNTLFDPRTLVEYIEAGTIGVLLGAAAGIAEQSVLTRWLQRRRFVHTIEMVLLAGYWLDCFSNMRASVAARRFKYEAKYGVAPEFKAGVHGGTGSLPKSERSSERSSTMAMC